MKTLTLLVSLAILISLSNGLVLPAVAPTTKAPFPWADFMKQKFASMSAVLPPAGGETPTEIATTTTTHPPTVFAEGLVSDFVKQLIAHIKSKAVNQTQTVNTTVPVTTVGPPPAETTEVEAEEPVENNYEDALMREVYLDWGTKRQARQAELELQGQEPEPAALQDYQYIQPEAPVSVPAPENAPAAQATVPLSYGYPATFPFGLFNPLIGLKAQKLAMQAQADAYLASLGITTTPKPTKVKLKFMLPAGMALPAGLESYVVSK